MNVELPVARRRVLILDDEPQIVDALEDALEDFCEIVSETTATPALNRVKDDKKIAAILCDQRMPEMNGDEFLKKAQLHSDATPLLITGYADLNAVIRAVNDGHIFGYLTKPWDVQTLIRTVIDAVSACEVQRELKNERALLHEIMTSVADGVFVKDTAGRFVRINNAENKILGVNSPGEAIGKTLRELLPEEIADTWSQPEQRVLAGAVSLATGIREIETQDGRRRSLSVKLTPRRSDKDRITGLVGVSRDVTDERDLERMKDQFVSTVSHELKTPLTSIIGSLSILRGGLLAKVAPEASNMIDVCSRNADRLLRLVNDLLDLQKIKSGKLEFQLARIRVSDLLAEALATNEGFGCTANQTIEIAEPVPQACIHGDLGRVLQVFSNLIANGLKFSPAGGRIRLRARVLGDRVRFSVTDQAGGVPNEFRARIFKAFSQANSSDARSASGSGLGLYISRSIIDALNGRLDYRSVKNRGSVFFFDLPLVTDAT